MIPYEILRDAQNQVIQAWDEDGKRIVELCVTLPSLDMTTRDFLDHCTAYGGNWGGMFLSGLHRLRPEVYDLIPDNMGV